jgi:penicillin-binding protein 1B
MMKNIEPEPLLPTVPEEIEMVNVDPVSGARYDDECKTGIMLPFIRGSEPKERSACAFVAEVAPHFEDVPVLKAEARTGVKPEPKQEPKKNWLQRLFN